MGKFVEAKNLLLSIDINKLSSIEKVILYYNNLTDILILTNDLAAARETLEKCFAALGDVKDEELHEEYADILQSNLISLEIAEGNYIGSDEFLVASLERAENKLSKIEAHTNLGEYYIFAKQNDKALIHLNYIVQHGNKLFHVEWAKKKIAEINALCAAV